MTSKVKFELSIGAEPVQVVECDVEYIEALAKHEFPGGIYGYSVSYPNYTSYVNKELPGRSKASTILHELLHNISSVYGLNLSEQNIRCLEQGIVQILGNREFSSYISKNLAQ